MRTKAIKVEKKVAIPEYPHDFTKMSGHAVHIDDERLNELIVHTRTMAEIDGIGYILSGDTFLLCTRVDYDEYEYYVSRNYEQAYCGGEEDDVSQED